MSQLKKRPCVVTIAGTDPSGGAGIQADIKAISATGSYAASVITALLAQNTQGVQAIEEVSPTFITQQIKSVFDDLTINAVKIGMLHNQAVIDAVILGLKTYRPYPIVIDPVMVAKNGCALLDMTMIDYLKKYLFPLATLITPNLFEAEKIVGWPITDTSLMKQAATDIGKQLNINVLIKGGHLETPQASDILYIPETHHYQWFHANRIDTKNTHGTGCTLSSSIASFLAQNYTMVDAIQAAKNYLTQAIQAGSLLPIGKGRGPVDHFYIL
ncbi:MAG: phosphomethylpyrimidine kinase [Gammaproteobacteria bacterium]|jgi:hydroxymethylpyrimidine/phosphomethylpyrimidine kinase|nr:phosphomethylpyrimidine kinase [Gammaproteobacteria bacterium]